MVFLFSWINLNTFSFWFILNLVLEVWIIHFLGNNNIHSEGLSFSHEAIIKNFREKKYKKG